jgi:hypothetical protein
MTSEVSRTGGSLAFALPAVTAPKVVGTACPARERSAGLDAPRTHKAALTPHCIPLAAHTHPRLRSTPTTRLRCCSFPTRRTCGVVARDWPPTLPELGPFQAQAVGSGLVQMCVRLATDPAPEPPSRRINAALDALSTCADVRWPHSVRHSLVSSVPSHLPSHPASAHPRHQSIEAVRIHKRPAAPFAPVLVLDLCTGYTGRHLLLPPRRPSLGRTNISQMGGMYAQHGIF